MKIRKLHHKSWKARMSTGNGYRYTPREMETTVVRCPYCRAERQPANDNQGEICLNI